MLKFFRNKKKEKQRSKKLQLKKVKGQLFQTSFLNPVKRQFQSAKPYQKLQRNLIKKVAMIRPLHQNINSLKKIF